ncbi:hypothetical protein [Microvirga antarctica]|uniref:hypothetical protein n=1 Tax=Microvirga antarctica TaxID=2819233 RepID=UPI001B3054AB|nr:hypothetical protein [Microvirga antarctica]
MSNGRSAHASSEAASGGRPVGLEGDSPELVAFALMRYLAQLEQERASQTGVVFDRDWLLDAYADCLEAVKGKRTKAPQTSPSAPAKPPRGRAPVR